MCCNQFLEPILWTYFSIAFICWNVALWLKSIIHLTCYNQSDYFISAFHRFATIKFVYDIWPRFELLPSLSLPRAKKHFICQFQTAERPTALSTLHASMLLPTERSILNPENRFNWFWRTTPWSIAPWRMYIEWGHLVQPGGMGSPQASTAFKSTWTSWTTRKLAGTSLEFLIFNSVDLFTLWSIPTNHILSHTYLL